MTEIHHHEEAINHPEDINPNEAPYILSPRSPLYHSMINIINYFVQCTLYYHSGLYFHFTFIDLRVSH